MALGPAPDSDPFLNGGVQDLTNEYVRRQYERYQHELYIRERNQSRTQAGATSQPQQNVGLGTYIDYGHSAHPSTQGPPSAGTAPLRNDNIVTTASTSPVWHTLRHSDAQWQPVTTDSLRTEAFDRFERLILDETAIPSPSRRNINERATKLAIQIRNKGKGGKKPESKTDMIRRLMAGHDIFFS